MQSTAIVQSGVKEGKRVEHSKKAQQVERILESLDTAGNDKRDISKAALKALEVVVGPDTVVEVLRCGLKGLLLNQFTSALSVQPTGLSDSFSASSSRERSPEDPTDNRDKAHEDDELNHQLSSLLSAHYRTLHKMCRDEGGPSFAKLNVQYGVAREEWKNCHRSGDGCKAAMISNINIMFNSRCSTELKENELSVTAASRTVNPGRGDIDELIELLKTLSLETLQDHCLSGGCKFSTANVKYGIDGESWERCDSTTRDVILEEMELMLNDFKSRYSVSENEELNQQLNGLLSAHYKTLQKMCKTAGGPSFEQLNQQYRVSSDEWSGCLRTGVGCQSAMVACIINMFGNRQRS